MPRSPQVLQRIGYAISGGFLGGLAAAGPSLRVIDHGPDARSAAFRLLIAAAAGGAIAAVATRPHGRVAPKRASVVALSAAAPFLVSWSTIGRLPGVIAASALLIGTVSLRRRGRWGILLLLAVILGESVWLALDEPQLALVAFPVVALAAWWAPTALGFAHDLANLARRSAVEQASTLLRVSTRLWAVVARRCRVSAASVPPRLNWPATFAGIFGAALALPVIYRSVVDPDLEHFGVQDFEIHLRLAREITFRPLHISVPHPVFHLPVRVFDNLLGLTWSPIIVLSAAVAVLVAAWATVLMNPEFGAPGLRPAAAAAVATAFVVLESPAVLAQVTGIAPAAMFTPVHLWGSPTETMALALAIPLFFRCSNLLSSSMTHRSGFGVDARLLALTLLSTMAKPSMTLALLAAIPALAGIDLSRGRMPNWKPFVLSFWLPGLLVVIGQMVFIRAGVTPETAGGITLDPFSMVPTLGWLDNGLMFWSAPLGVICLILTDRRRFMEASSARLAVLALLFGVIMATSLRETGVRAADGNLAKAGYYGWVAVFLVAIKFSLIELREAVASVRDRTHHWRTLARVAVVGSLLLTFTVSGVLAQIGQAGAFEMSRIGVSRER